MNFSVGFISARKRSCGKVMFLHLSVILFMGGILCPGGVSVWQVSVRVEGESLSKGWSLSRGVSVMETPPYSGRAGGTHPTGMHSCLSLISFCY